MDSGSGAPFTARTHSTADVVHKSRLKLPFPLGPPTRTLQRPPEVNRGGGPAGFVIGMLFGKMNFLWYNSRVVAVALSFGGR